MNKVSRLAVAGAVALVLGSSTAVFAADAAASSAPVPKGQVSPAAAKDLQAAQKAVAAKNFDESLADLDRVKANPKKNDYDEYLMNEFYLSSYGGQKKLAEAAGAMEAVIASKYTSATEMQQRLVQASYLYYQLKDYDKAIDYGNRAISAGDTTEQLQTVVAQSYYLKDDFKGAEHASRTSVEGLIKAGQAPSLDFLQLGVSAASKLKDEAAQTYWLEQLVTYHPSQEYWIDLLDPLYRNKKLTDRQQLQLYRLAADVGTLQRGAEYADMAQTALSAGSPGEAVATLNKGFAANAFTDAADKNRNQHLLDSAKKAAAADEPTLAKTEAAAANAATGDALVGAGIGYFSYGDYEKAIKDISAGLAKGTTKDPADARILLGIAQLRSGTKDAAIQTFQSVKGDPVYERLAALWILHAKAPDASHGAAS